MQEIKKTTDYSIFKKLDGNRGIVRSHVNKLVEAIRIDNQLELHPIVINKDYAVIDGQHRLEAAKRLSKPIYYLKSDTVSDLHLVECNSNQKTFKMSNFVDFFALKDKNPEYIQLKNLFDNHKLSPKALLCLVIGNCSTPLLTMLKSGKFRFPSDKIYLETLAFYDEFMAYVKDKRITPMVMFTAHGFSKAVRWLFLTKGFDKQVFFTKLDQRWFHLKPQARAENWYELLVEIYNFRNQSAIELEYGKTSV
jgi:ParB-like nuclease domain